MLRKLEKLTEAEISFRQAIALNPEYAQAYSNLGVNLKDLGRFEEAEVNFRKAINIDQNYTEAHCNLSIILYANGNLDSAIESIEKASSSNSESKSIKLLLAILQARKINKSSKTIDGKIINSDFNKRLTSNPLILKRTVEAELIAKLYEMKSLELNKIKDPSYGNARGSDYNLFQGEYSIINTVEKDLVRIMVKAIETDIYVEDSFFTILSGGGGVSRHNHITDFDKNSSLNLTNQKFSLVYYLLIGDQNCKEPGTLKLFNPSEDILPIEGMITIFPADRYHSVVYSGKKDRVMIGINFYSL